MKMSRQQDELGWRKAVGGKKCLLFFAALHLLSRSISSASSRCCCRAVRDNLHWTGFR